MVALERDLDETRGAGGPRPLIVHIVHRLDYGGMENGVVNILNHLPAAEFDHAIVPLTDATEFSRRIRRSDIAIYPLRKRPGSDWGAYLRLWKLLRKLRPAIVHTRNVGTMDCQFWAWAAGVPARVHGEHGWDVHDPDGTNRKFLTVRRVLSPFVHAFVTVSRDLERWLIERVGVAAHRVRQICNGVDTQRFRPGSGAARRAALASSSIPDTALVIGSVSRLSEIKDPLNLVRAFLSVRKTAAGARRDVRLALIGDGPLRAAVEAEVRAAGEQEAVWIAGARDDVPELMRAFDVFVLGSLREGISNTVLEAMSTGLPVIASATGGNLELVAEGVTGRLVPPGDSAELARAILDYVEDDGLRIAHGAAARARAEQTYSLDGMMARYRELYATHSGRPVRLPGV